VNVLLDECLPRRLARALVGHDVKTVQQSGWAGKTNGDLLRLMQGRFEVFITIDSNLLSQQKLTNLPIALVVLSAKSNKFEDIEPLVPDILHTLASIKPGQVARIG
jgi:predicted nuclease of predicted toxin-antitoxin system